MAIPRKPQEDRVPGIFCFRGKAAIVLLKLAAIQAARVLGPGGAINPVPDISCMKSHSAVSN